MAILAAADCGYLLTTSSKKVLASSHSSVGADDKFEVRTNASTSKDASRKHSKGTDDDTLSHNEYEEGEDESHSEVEDEEVLNK